MADYLALKAELAEPAYSGLTDQQTADALNAADPGNPVPVPFTIAQLLGCLVAGDPPAPDSVALNKVYGRPAVARFADDVKAQDRAAVLNWLQIAYATGDISQAQYAAMAAVVNATQAGPSKAVQVFGVPVTNHDVARARSL